MTDECYGALCGPKTTMWIPVAVEVVEPLAVVAAVPKRKVGFDAEVPPAKAAAGATPGLPFYSTAAGLAAVRLNFVRRSRRTEKAARGAQPEKEERTDGELNWVQRPRLWRARWRLRNTA